MPNAPTEADLCDVVVAKLRATGWRVVCEIPFFGRRIDVVALKGKTLCCVEVKLAFTDTLFRQAKDCQITADWVVCAIAGNVTDRIRKIILNTGIGLWQIVGDEIITHQQPNTREPAGAYKQKMTAKVMSASEETRGGLPCSKNSGYLRKIAEDVATFRAANPKATWPQIYEAIKSPYSSGANLYSALRKYTLRELRNPRNDGGFVQ